MDAQLRRDRREELRESLIKGFSRHPEVTTICLFGGEVEAKVDEFSDIDIVVCSRNASETQRTYLRTLEKISSIQSRLLLESTPRQFAEMIMLSSFSPYQKIDLSIVSDMRDKAAFGPFLTVYEKKQDDYDVVASAARLNVVPLVRDTDYVLRDVLFSVPRFTKCLFRRHPDMYRRWIGLSNRAIVLLYEKRFGWDGDSARRSLNATETKRLVGALTDQERQQIETIYPSEGRLDLARSYRSALELIVELSRIKAEHLGVTIDGRLISSVTAFLDRELSKYDKPCRL